MTERVEFGSKMLADQYREEYAEHLCEDDDARLKTVAFASSVPEAVLERARLEAQEGRAQAEGKSVTASLTAGERERIKKAGGFDRSTTTINWRSAKGVFAREGLADQFFDAIGSLTDYDDPAEGAEEYIEQNRLTDAREGTQSVSGGARDEGVQEAQETRKIAEQSRKAQAESCDHAEGHCRHGDPEACEFLTEVCGYSDDDVGTILEDVHAGDEIEGKAAGALKRAWQGYKGGISTLDEQLEDLRESWSSAQQAARAINRVREAHGQDRMHFERLEELQGELADWANQAAEDCHECHVGLDRDGELEDVGVVTIPTEPSTAPHLDGPEETDTGGLKWEYEPTGDVDRLDLGTVLLLVTSADDTSGWEFRVGFMDFLEAHSIAHTPTREEALEEANRWVELQESELTERLQKLHSSGPTETVGGTA